MHEFPDDTYYEPLAWFMINSQLQQYRFVPMDILYTENKLRTLLPIFGQLYINRKGTLKHILHV